MCWNYRSRYLGWVTVLAWQSVAAHTTYRLATLINKIDVETRVSFQTWTNQWYTVLLFWALSIFAAIINSISGRFLVRFQNLALIGHVLGFFGILIPMLYIGRPYASVKQVFMESEESRVWSSPALCFLVALPSSLLCLMGADGAVHVSTHGSNLRASLFSPYEDGRRSEIDGHERA
jgi:choline transport protein